MIPLRRYALIAFPWIDSARQTDESRVLHIVGRLLGQGTRVVIQAPDNADIREKVQSASSGVNAEDQLFVAKDIEATNRLIQKLMSDHQIPPKDVLDIDQGSSDLIRVLDNIASSLPEGPHPEPAWVIKQEGYNPAREMEIESILTVANGYAGTRGTLFERGSPLGPGTLVAGVFDAIPGENPVPGLVAAPDWVRLRMDILATEQECGLSCGRIMDNRRVLDMNGAMMWRELRHSDNDGRVTSVSGFRLASQADRHLFIQFLELKPENYSGRVRIEAETELYQGRHKSYLNPYPIKSTVAKDPTRTPGTPAIVKYTYQSGREIAFAAASRLIIEGTQVVYPEITRIENRVAEAWEFDVELGKTYYIHRLVSVYTSRETDRPSTHAREHLKQAWEKGFKKQVQAHLDEWRRRWVNSNVDIEGDLNTDRALRFACYNLLSAANPEDEKVSIGARALTGNSYLGHVFWDTEIFMLPFFIYTAPDIARSLLMYRYHTLPGARKNAQKNGYAGAMYAWESADTGEETTPSSMLSTTGERIRILTGEQEHHITADVAYAVLHYSDISGDTEFLHGPGAEIMIETARFWASRVTQDPDGRYHIEHAIGPDEYHEDISDSVYTNEMARWNLRVAASLVRDLAENHPDRWNALATRLSFNVEETNRWGDIAQKLVTARIRDGVIEQFRGYFDLEDLTTTKENQPGGVDFRIFLDLERLGKTQLLKQADVVMMLYLFWEGFSEEERRKSFEYYENRTLHGSSLSPAIYGLIAARLGLMDKAARYYQMAAEVDLRNNMGNASGGVHSAAQGGLWQATVMGYAGMSASSQGITFSPRLPENWKSVRFRIIWHKQPIEARISRTEVELVHLGEITVPVGVGNSGLQPLHPRKSRRWQLAEENRWQEVA